jgi:hypothetical protein
MMRTFTTFLAVCWIAALSLAACGGDDETNTPTIDAEGGVDTAGGGGDGAVIDGAGGADGSALADAGPTTDAPGMSGVVCGADTCDATEKCCITVSGMATMSTCVPLMDPCGGVALECDGPEDCDTGDTCCAAPMGAEAGCRGVCMGLALCHTTADCPTDEPNCCPSMVLSASICSATACP